MRKAPPLISRRTPTNGDLRAPDAAEVPDPGAAVRRTATVFGLLALSCLALTPALAAPEGAPVVTAVYPPWWSAARAFDAAARQGLVIRPGRVPFLVVVRLTAPADRQRLSQGGALFLLNQQAGACAAPETN